MSAVWNAQVELAHCVRRPAIQIPSSVNLSSPVFIPENPVHFIVHVDKLKSTSAVAVRLYTWTLVHTYPPYVKVSLLACPVASVPQKQHKLFGFFFFFTSVCVCVYM